MEGNKGQITLLFINMKIDITLLWCLMSLKLKCDMCGKKLEYSNIGFVSHPREDHLKPTMRCKECHNKIKEKKRKRNSSYMILED